MSSASTITSPRNASEPAPPAVADQEARLELKPDGPTTGYVDGGWWPRSRKMEVELPALVAALGQRLGRVESVSYHLGDWDAPPRIVNVEGAAVRLAGYRVQRTGSVDVIARDQRVTLVVVGPEYTEQAAREVLTASAGSGNTDDVSTLLANDHPAATAQKEDRT
jgi:hypothetical protein